ncbi:unnamed protein product, partial [Rotaria sordida]
ILLIPSDAGRRDVSNDINLKSGTGLGSNRFREF